MVSGKVTKYEKLDTSEGNSKAKINVGQPGEK
jgi:hypothetical protein